MYQGSDRHTISSAFQITLNVISIEFSFCKDIKLRADFGAEQINKSPSQHDGNEYVISFKFHVVKVCTLGAPQYFGCYSPLFRKVDVRIKASMIHGNSICAVIVSR